MTTIAEWFDKEEKNVYIDDLPLSNQFGMYTNKIMTAVKKKFDSVDATLSFLDGSYVYRGEVASVANLPTSGQHKGDVYSIAGTGDEYVWNGSAWELMGPDDIVRLSGNQNIDGIKTFIKSPLVPTPAHNDSSQKAVNTAWVNAVFTDEGGFAYDEDNDIFVIDFSKLPPERVREIILGMIRKKGGLAVGDDDGLLYVDFNEMDMEAFQTLVDAIHVPFWVGEKVGGVTIGSNFYVNNAHVEVQKEEYDRHNLGGYVRQVSSTWKWFRYRKGISATKAAQYQTQGKFVESEGTGEDQKWYYLYNPAADQSKPHITGDVTISDAKEVERHQAGGCVTSVSNGGEPETFTYYWWIGNNVELDTDGTRYGRSKMHPWRTIAYATETLAKNYNINSKDVNLYVHGTTYTSNKFIDTTDSAYTDSSIEDDSGIYTQTVDLPMQQRTTGSITIRPDGETGPVKVEYTSKNGGSLFDHSGGVWVLRDLDIKYTMGEQTSKNPVFHTIVNSTDSTGHVAIRHCNLSFVDNALAASAGVRGSSNGRLIRSNGGCIHVGNLEDDTGGTEENPQPVMDAYSSTWTGTKVNSSIRWLYIENGGSVIARTPSATALSGYVVNVSGSFTIFCNAVMSGFYRNTGSGINLSWVYMNGATNLTSGKKYELTSGGTVSTGKATPAGAENYFPGDTAGTFSAGTYSWISPVNHMYKAETPSSINGSDYREDGEHHVYWTSGSSFPYTGPADGFLIVRELSSVENAINDDRVIQILFSEASGVPVIDVRYGKKDGSSWGSWYSATMTERT